ncbi:MAG: hypothetical protein RML40_03065 [Bacteroidota bacterium]|nr:hypothetical protein [Candidatus Kapabacteria bacterium]MDW8219491.1 hypothetical protein [Bacteroidota bacterium]
MTFPTLPLATRAQSLHFRAIGVLVLLSGCLACSVVQPVRVLPEGTTQMTVSLGGPWLPKSSPVIIAPYLNLGAMHGISDNLTLTGSIHGTMLPFGVLGLDAGAALRLATQQGAMPELTAKAQFYSFYDFVPGSTSTRPVSPDGATPAGTFRLYPYLSLNASYELAQGFLGYVALENLFQFTSAPHYYFTPTVGLQYALSSVLSVQGEWKWLAANVNTMNGIFQGQSSIGEHGNWGVYIGFNWTIARKHDESSQRASH